MTSHRHRKAKVALLTSCGMLAAMVVSLPASAEAQTTWNTTLKRYPYLTDVTSSSVRITWATSVANNKGVVQWGPVGNCSQNTTTAASSGIPYTITVGGASSKIYQNSVNLTGLSAATTYCYRVLTSKTTSTAVTDLLGAEASPTFTTVPAVGSNNSYSFAVVGDWGDTTDASGSNTGAGPNVNQEKIDASLASSGAAFAVSTGDIGYPNGTVTQYGDLDHTGKDISAVFAPNYWKAPGAKLPLFPAVGNHGPSATFINTWPTTSVVEEPGEKHKMESYASFNGSRAQTYPSSWYAFTVGGARFYVLTASWAENNVGTATGGVYEMDHDAHWTSTSPEYQWLKSDLQSHPGGLKFAFFHYPLRSDNGSDGSDPYLQNSSANPTGASSSLEALLNSNGVNLAFNGHTHIYQRNVAPPGGVVSYVTGGGGARLMPANKSGKCSGTNAYGLGWAYSSGAGSNCGAAPKPTSPAQVFHYLKVDVSGSRVTVTPVNAAGSTFDTQTYDFSSDSEKPDGPSGLTFTPPSSSNVTMSWAAGRDNVGVMAYDIYRGTTYVDTVPGSVTTYKDTGYTAGSGYTIKARDIKGNTSDGVTGSPGASDTTPPDVPSGATATATGPSSVTLSWNPSQDNAGGSGLAGYNVYRNGASTPVAVVAAPATSWTDSAVQPRTTYQYTVSAVDVSGNTSAKSSAATVTTPSDGSVSILAVDASDDATIDSANSTANAGTKTRIITDGSPVNDFLVKFPVSGIGGTSCPTVTKAKIRMTVGTSTDDNSTKGGSLFATDNRTWSEGSVNWSNAPAVAGSALASLGAVVKGTSYLVDVSGAVPGNGDVTFRVSSTSGDAARYFSRNDTTAGSLPPQLQLSCTGGGGAAPDTEAPTAPGKPTVGTTTSSSVSLSWSPSTDNVGVDKYEIFRGTSLAGSATGTAFTDTGLTSSTTYSYTVQAIDAAGNRSLASPGAPATTLAAPGGGGGVLTFAAARDATVESGVAAPGGSTRLTVDHSPVTDALLAFNVTGVGSGTDCPTVSSAKLRLTVGSGGTDNSSKGGDFFAAGSGTWDESTVTYASAPARSGSVLSSLGAVTTNQTVLVDLKTAVTGNGTYNVRISSTSSDGVRYFSRESGSTSQVPQLQLTCGSGTGGGTDPTEGTVTATLLDDATIDPAKAKPTSSRLAVDASGPINDTLLKFAVPATCTSIISAALRLTVGSGSTDVSKHGGDFFATLPDDPNSAWAEGSVTWGSAPAKNTGVAAVSLGAVTTGTTYDVDVTRIVPASGGTFTIRASSSSADGAAYLSQGSQQHERSATSAHLRLTRRSCSTAARTHLV